MDAIMPERKNTLSRANSRLDVAKDKISKLEQVIIETTQNEMHVGKKNSMRELWAQCICDCSLQEWVDREKQFEDIMAESL